MRQFKNIFYNDMKGHTHFLLLISVAESDIRLCPITGYERLPIDWEKSFIERLDKINDTFKPAEYDISIQDNGITIHGRNNPITIQTFEVVRKVVTSVLLKHLTSSPVVIKTGSNNNPTKVEVYFNFEKAPAMFISLDLRDLNIKGVKMGLSLCENCGIIVVEKSKEKLPKNTSLNDVIERVLETISEYCPKD